MINSVARTLAYHEDFTHFLLLKRFLNVIEVMKIEAFGVKNVE